MVALDSRDFGNFLTHPKIRPPNISADNSKLQFLRDDISIDPISSTVNFYALLDGEKWMCSLRRGQSNERRAVIEVTRTNVVDLDDGKEELENALHELQEDNSRNLNASSFQLSSELSKFFNEIVFELDGSFLTFQDMMVTEKGASPSVILKMGIRVERFPSRNLAF